MKKNTAILQLLLATMLWGFGFIATVWALKVYTPVEALTYRFLLASAIGLIVEVIRQKSFAIFSRAEILSSIPAGLLLGLMQLTQTIGLRTTTATKGGFITSLYVILVPLISAIFLRVNSPRRVYVLAGFALAGTYLLMGATPDSLTIGDLWIFVCAIFAAVHIIYIGRVAKTMNNAFGFNTLQSLWSFLILAPLLLMQKDYHFATTDMRALFGVLFLVFGSSIVAFFLQLKAQRYLSNTMTTILSLLESPFAAFFGFWLLAETLDFYQTLGATLILGTSLAYVIMESPKSFKS